MLMMIQELKIFSNGKLILHSLKYLLFQQIFETELILSLDFLSIHSIQKKYTLAVISVERLLQQVAQ